MVKVICSFKVDSPFICEESSFSCSTIWEAIHLLNNVCFDDVSKIKKIVIKGV